MTQEQFELQYGLLPYIDRGMLCHANSATKR